MARKKFEELNLSNAFLFAAALEDEEICRIILEVILGRELPKVKVHVEHSIMYSSELRSIRLDVYASDEVEIGYNLEMQNKDKAKLPKRSRFHQAEIDIAALKPGDDFDALKPTYIIFICTFDPFADKLYRYTFEERCLERDFPLGDGTCKIFLNTKGINHDEVPAELIHFLHYVENSSETYVKASGDNRLEKLHDKVQVLKRSRRWRENYMTLDEYIRDLQEDMREELKEELREEVKSEVQKEMRQELEGAMRQELKDEVQREVRQELKDEVQREVRQELKSEVQREVRQELKSEVQRELEAENQKRFMKLISAMALAGEVDLLPKLGEDEALLTQMFRKYSL